MAETRKAGQFNETQYFDNVGGLNISDSPFKVKDTESTGGANFEYTQTGGIQKRRGAQKINTVADTQLQAHGIDVYVTTANTKTIIRAAERKIQAVDTSALSFTNLSQDTAAAGTDVFPASTTFPTSYAPYNTDTVSLLNFCGATDGVYSVYSPTKFTRNGAVQPAGTISATTLSTGGAWTTSGNFWYGISWHKASTGATSNVTLDLSVSVTTTLQTNTISLLSVTSVDHTTYDYGQLWRSAVNGVTGFTVGDLVTSFSVSATTVSDTGSALLRTQNVARANSVVLDNSVLPTGTYNGLTLWKRRLVTATGNTLRFSDLNVPESWPAVNTITIPSGGPVTGLAVIAFNTDYGNDEYLAVFQERQLWLVRGNDYTDVTLSFIDSVGCANQALIQLANGFLTWVDYRGIYLWDGSGKPIYCSDPISPYFAIDGDLDKTKLAYGTSSFFRNRNMVYWFLSSKVAGTQKLVIKMDLRLTLPGVESTLSGRVISAVFVNDTTTIPVYGAKTYLPSASSDEIMVTGDASGFVYLGYQQFSDAGTGIDFQYLTPFLDMGAPNTAKRFHKIILWVDAIGSWNVTLDYWAGYRASLSQKSTLQAPITTQAQNSTSLWDVGFWDQSLWDDYTQSLAPVVFNLNNSQGNQEGDCIRMKFRNNGVDQPVTIYGYSVEWTELAMRK
jgi:hypothetical protein